MATTATMCCRTERDSDTVHGGAGDDHVVAAADAADDAYDGGAGQDTLDYSTATFSITVDLGSGTADGHDIGHDLIAAFEEVIAGSGDDHIVAGSTSVSMTGGDGNDTFEFQRAEDDQQAMTVRKITDFTVGDRIVAATYEISYLKEDGVEERNLRHVRRHLSVDRRRQSPGALPVRGIDRRRA